MTKSYSIQKISIIFFLASGFWFITTNSAFAMHISEGILPLKWAGLWYLAALPFILKGIVDIKTKAREIAHFKVLLGFMGALVFIISCMPVPVPTAGTCSHPAGTGISTILIGPIMSIFVTSIALFIQALFLAHGGLTTWGADIVSMGIAGSFAGYFAFKVLRRFNASLFVSGFAAGVLADWATYITTSFELAAGLHGKESMLHLFMSILIAFIPTQLPLGILEGLLTGGMVLFVYKRRPDIMASLGVINPANVSAKPITRKSPSAMTFCDFQWLGKCFILSYTIKNSARIIFILLISLSLTGHFAFAEGAKWSGVDVSVVEKVAEEHGRTAWMPFINTDQGDLLLFVFLLSGTAGGFVMGYNFRKLFAKKQGEKC